MTITHRTWIEIKCDYCGQTFDATYDSGLARGWYKLELPAGRKLDLCSDYCVLRWLKKPLAEREGKS